MRDFGENTAYFVSYAKLPEDMSAKTMYNQVGVGFLINMETGIIEDVVITLVSEMCREFLKFLMVGHNIRDNGVDELIRKVELRYHGHAQKAVVVAIKGTYERYLKWAQK